MRELDADGGGTLEVDEVVERVEAFHRQRRAFSSKALAGVLAEVSKTPSWPRSWANFSLLQLYSHRNAWANLHLLGQPNTFLAGG